VRRYDRQIPLIELAVWTQGRPRYSWRERVRHAWHALTADEMQEWGDQIMLSPTGTADLIAALHAAAHTPEGDAA
jgi:hypothetical protein